MDNKKKENACVFHITGGNNQILPNVTEVVQHFYVDRSEMVAMEDFSRVRPCVEPMDSHARRVMLAEGELRIYYEDDALLDAIIVRLGACRDAADLANLVVNDMMEHTIISIDIAVKSHFIETLLVFVRFTKGSSVSNVRQHIRKKSIEMARKRKTAL